MSENIVGMNFKQIIQKRKTFSFLKNLGKVLKIECVQNKSFVWATQKAV